MTANQINYWALQETKRANLAKEQETERSNLAKEAETFRSNVAREKETAKHNRFNEGLSVADTVLKHTTGMFSGLSKLFK